MSGSLRWFRYVSDAGTAYSVRLDESNSEALLGTTPLMQNRTAAHPLPPKGFKLRYINAFNTADPNIKRKFYLGSSAAVAQVAAGAALTAATYPGQTASAWTYTSIRGEKSPIAPPLNTTSGDTGLTDGDQGQDQV
jgi:hypothetical protein